jgi:hypothetical protein
MKPNIGSTDRILRIVAGIVLIVLFFVLTGPIRWIGVLGVVFIATAAMNFCPLYVPLGWSTKGKEAK